MKSKKQLEGIKKCIINEKGRLNIFYKIGFEIVEQDLDRLEKLENNIDNLKIENVDLKLRNKELEKVIEILKNKFFIDLIERQEDGKLGFVPINPIENQPVFAEITKEEFDLLKEVLEDGRD